MNPYAGYTREGFCRIRFVLPFDLDEDNGLS